MGVVILIHDLCLLMEIAMASKGFVCHPRVSTNAIILFWVPSPKNKSVVYFQLLCNSDREVKITVKSYRLRMRPTRLRFLLRQMLSTTLLRKQLKLTRCWKVYHTPKVSIFRWTGFLSLVNVNFISLQLKHTPEFMELARYQALTTNTKLYFGPSLPSFFMQGREEGLLLPRQQTSPVEEQTNL